jgi:3-hydroxyisobutyrate dehydrogenase
MAQSLRRAGHVPFVFDVRSEVAAAFAANGGSACTSPADLARQCAVVVSVVVNAAQTESVLFGEQGCASAMALPISPAVSPMLLPLWPVPRAPSEAYPQQTILPLLLANAHV